MNPPGSFTINRSVKSDGRNGETREEFMFVWDLFFVFMIAIILTAVIGGAFRRSGPRESLVVFFFIIFLAAWAGGIWIHPFGPPFFGVFWLPFLIVGLIVALLVAALEIPEEKRKDTPRAGAAERVSRAEMFSLFFWLFLVILVISIIFGYLAGPRVIVV